jgi:hypothetical protein
MPAYGVWTSLLGAILLAGALFSRLDAGRHNDYNQSYRWSCEAAHGRVVLNAAGAPECIAR